MTRDEKQNATFAQRYGRTLPKLTINCASVPGTARFWIDTETQSEDRVHRIGCERAAIVTLEEITGYNLKAMAMLLDMKHRSVYRTWIGRRVQKPRKPFKSGLRVNTVKAVVEHPITGRPAFTFQEDASVVECRICSLEEA